MPTAKEVLENLANNVTDRMVQEANCSYDDDYEYGIGDEDMKKAIQAALRVAIEDLAE